MNEELDKVMRWTIIALSILLLVNTYKQSTKPTMVLPPREKPMVMFHHNHLKATPKTQEVELVADEWVIPLTKQEFDYITRVVMAESGNQSLLGQMAVAQCIADSATYFGKTPMEVVTTPKQYSKPFRGDVADSVITACERVFKYGEKAVNERLLYFYSLATDRVSRWHESKNWVCTIEDHKFFN